MAAKPTAKGHLESTNASISRSKGGLLGAFGRPNWRSCPMMSLLGAAGLSKWELR